MMRKSVFLLITHLLFVFYVHSAQHPPPKVTEIAEKFASGFHNGKIDQGYIYFGPAKGDKVWVFVIYKGSNLFPTDDVIMNKITRFREKQQAAEKLIKISSANGDASNVKMAQVLYNKALQEIHNKQDFATIYIAEWCNGHKVFAKAIHEGLPLHYTAIFDAEDELKKEFKINNFRLNRILYFSHFSVWGEFIVSNEKIYINLLKPSEKKINNISLLPANQINYNHIGTQNTAALFEKKTTRTSYSTNQQTPDWKPQIPLIPDYYATIPNPCALISCVSILGYWERKFQGELANYDNIISGGDWDYAGTNYNPPDKTCIGDGWLGLAFDEIGCPIHWSPATGVCGVEAIKNCVKVMNSPFRNRNYNFKYNVICEMEELNASFNLFCDAVNSGRPFQYNFYGWITYLYSPTGDTTNYEYITLYQNHCTVGCGFKRFEPETPVNHWRCIMCGCGNTIPSPQWVCDADCGYDPSGNYTPFKVEIVSMNPGVPHWSGIIETDEIWQKHIYIEDTLIIKKGVTLLLKDSTMVEVKGVLINEGIINTQNDVSFSLSKNFISNGTINLNNDLSFCVKNGAYFINNGIINSPLRIVGSPDIRLVAGGKLKRLCPTLQAGFNVAQPNDLLLLHSHIRSDYNLNFTCDFAIDSSGIMNTEHESKIRLNSYILRIHPNGQLRGSDNLDIYPDIRLVNGTIIKGFFPGTSVAMRYANRYDQVQINCKELWHTSFASVCDILVNREGEVIIPAAKTIAFESGCRLAVKGRLIVDGRRGANQIALNAVNSVSNPFGFWDGIWFENGSSGALKHLYILSADYGINLGPGSRLEANNCIIQNNYWGIYGNNASCCQLDSCLISQNRIAGVTACPLNFKMQCGCKIKFNGDGIQSQSSYPEIRYTEISNNMRAIVACGGGIDMGRDLISYGYNSIFNNSCCDLDVFPYTFIWAIGNYWGGGQPTDIHYNNGGNVIWWPVLPYPPLNKNQNTPNEQQIQTLAKPKPGDNVILADPLSLIMPAIELRKNKDYAAAASSLEAIINEYPQSEAALAALWELARTYHKANTDSPGVKLASNLSADLSRMLPNFKFGKSEVHSQLYPTTLKLLTYEYLRTSATTPAIETCQQLIQEFPGTSFEEEGWWSLFNTYYFLLADTSQAKSCYEQLKQNFPKSEFLVHAYHALDLDDVQLFVKEQLDAEIPPPTPVKYYLSSAYPNPFNSSTSIKYDLPESDQVSLKIYNIEGQLVTELVNKTQPAGTWQVIWDGKNSQQEAVTSGIYFCQFKTRQYWQTVRVILLR